ncbi:hypothetical protein SISNIDRAFT_552392 [Sistotremastrum niveocremeum HHB9708]|uniref:GIT Spa2 homology (SHD) domain-containing protein n=2 Tax=Sistotremastraceae TaxID=3402574 RepID=A0A164PPR0_9AGAM|nr:hypothetical protein SISNIDRAFT_552392 [Sistotremastrum niveocremeum HHB9708]KZT41965.1 hypothetical protein SISSUDRAFT_1126119 [Sistotremastrum suecicum HHB10207 ss-3]
MLRPNSQRSVSPANTTFSGISSYRSESYRARDNNIPNVPQIDPRITARTHFDELSSFLSSHLSKEAQGSRSNAREKLTRLTLQQFQELSTDVYDELVRRNGNSSKNEVPFLPVREDFHPKRNQARQKLATLPKPRFKDLSSDVYYELGRRYPEFKEPELPETPASPGSTYDDTSSPATAAQTTPEEISFSSTFRRKPSQDGPSTSTPYRRPSVESQKERTGRPSLESNPSSSYSGTTRRPSRGGSDAPALPSTAKSGVIIPNKSTIAEEDPIEVPFGNGSNGGADTSGAKDTDGERDLERESDSDFGPSPKSPEPVGLNALTGRVLGNSTNQPSSLPIEDSDTGGGATRSGDEYFDKMSFGRTSVASDRSAPLSRNPSRVGRDRESALAEKDREDLKKEYEYKIATLQKKANGSEERVRMMEEELNTLRGKAEEHVNAMRELEKELEELRSSKEQERAAYEEEKSQEVKALTERCEQLEDQLQNSALNSNDDLVDQLRANLEGLISELNDLSARNEELLSNQDEDAMIKQSLESQVKEYKRKYEQAKTELRGLKATSQLFLQAPKSEDSQQLPISSNGGVLDIHLTAFQSAIDSLLTVGRSNTPAKVLDPMKSVVVAASAIIDDVRAFERHPRRDVDLEAVKDLRDRAEATLSNLVIASKTHAQSYGLSPVSLLDAAASHVSSTVVEIAKCIFIRRSTKSEQDQYVNGTMSPGPAPPANLSSMSTNGTSMSSYVPNLRSLDDVRDRDRRQRTNGTTSSAGSRAEMSPPPSTSQRPLGRTSSNHRRIPSEPSSSNASSPPPIFDTPLATANSNAVASDESGLPENPDEAWAELRPYLEAQSESMVYAIQSVLSAVRSPNASPNLNEHLTQIITIVSSIVAVCKDSLPPGSVQQGNQILRDLSDHCNKLSEVQALPEVTKEARQTMAKSSFAVANAMKGLMKL